MNTKRDFTEDMAQIVYVKPVDVADLPDEVQDEVGELEQLFAVHDAMGQQLALVADRRLAFDIARQNDLTPLTLH